MLCVVLLWWTRDFCVCVFVVVVLLLLYFLSSFFFPSLPSCYEKQNLRVFGEVDGVGIMRMQIAILVVAVAIIFHKLSRTWFNLRKREWIHNAPKPPIFKLYPNILSRAESQNICAPYKNNLAAKRLLHSASYCETVVVILSSSATFETRAVTVYNLLHLDKTILDMAFESQSRKLCTFVLLDDFGNLSKNADVPCISRPSNTSWYQEKLYHLAFNYDIAGRGSKAGFQERVAEFLTLVALSCLPKFKYILLFDDDTIFSPKRYYNLLEDNVLLRSSTSVFAGKRHGDCNVLCGGAGMLFSFDIIQKLRSKALSFYQFYSRYYSKHVDVRLTRFILEYLMIKPIHLNEFLNDPPGLDNACHSETKCRKEAIAGAVTIHHMPFNKGSSLFDDIVSIFYDY